MSWWDSAYRSGRVNWDPGPYDRHLPRLLEDCALEPCEAIDLGCGTGKSAVWLATNRFTVTGVDLSPAAIETARRNALAAGVRCRFLVGEYPDDFPDGTLPPHTFGLVVERGFLQHFPEGPSLRAVLDRTVRLMKPGGTFYSLMAASEGASGYEWLRRWSERDIRRALGAYFTIVEMRLSVFTPGEAGSIPAWVTVMKAPESG